MGYNSQYVLSSVSSTDRWFVWMIYCNNLVMFFFFFFFLLFFFFFLRNNLVMFESVFPLSSLCSLLVVMVCAVERHSSVWIDRDWNLILWFSYLVFKCVWVFGVSVAFYVFFFLLLLLRVMWHVKERIAMVWHVY